MDKRFSHKDFRIKDTLSPVNMSLAKFGGCAFPLEVEGEKRGLA